MDLVVHYRVTLGGTFDHLTTLGLRFFTCEMGIQSPVLSNLCQVKYEVLRNSLQVPMGLRKRM